MEELAPFGAPGLEDEAEEHLVRVLEDRRARASSSPGQKNLNWDASVEGETPPLRRLSVEGINMLDPIQEEKKLPGPSKRMMKLARKVMKLKSQGKLSDNKQSPLESMETSQRRKTLGQIKEGDERQESEGAMGEVDISSVPSDDFFQANTSTNRLFSVAAAVDENFNKEADTNSIASETADDESTDEELLPLTGAREGNEQTGCWLRYGAAETQEANRIRNDARKKKWGRRRKKFFKSLEKCCCYNHHLANLFHPIFIAKSIIHFLTSSWFIKVGLPCLLTACFLFYYMGNPTLDFMNQATASWWLIFFARQTLTLELALITESLMIGLALRSKTVVKIVGPLVTLFVINAKGWPFVTTSWAIWDLFILHGDDKFKQNWLYFAKIPIFSPLNRGGRHILEDKLYLRILLAMMMVGLLTAIKRTIVAIHLGKRTFVNYKPRLEKLLADILLITEVAEVASEADVIAKMTEERNSSVNEAVAEKKRAGMLQNVQWKSLREFGGPQMSSSRDQSDIDLISSGSMSLEASQFEGMNVEDDLTDSDESARGNDSESESDENNDADPSTAENEVGDSTKIRNSAGRSTASAYVSASKIKRLLDRWEEPISKGDKTTETSISDILKFRKALSYMDDSHPFSLSFGPAATRDECIRSAQRTYRRLMKLEPADANYLSFDIIGLVAFDAEGTEDEAKMLELRNMFRPGRFNEITLIAFVQACDSLYKNLRYFRASVGNASLIDHVLERIIDNLFAFVLILVTLMILDINPWPLLVSVSTLLVSFAFAIGPSLSRYIDGLLMIVVRRPYDLGDRILISNTESAADPSNVTSSWFVQDITIFSSTLRFGPTNEIATVDNGALARSRIVNYNRSPDALITLNLRFCLASPEQILVFREALEGFVLDRPRIWSQIMFFRCENIDKDAFLMEYTLRVRHTKAWQDAASILMSKSELFEFCYELGEKLEMNFDPPIRSMRVTNYFAPSPTEETTGTMDKSKSTVPSETASEGKSAAAKALFLQLKGLPS